MARSVVRGELALNVRAWRQGFKEAGNVLGNLERRARTFAALNLFAGLLGLRAAVGVIAEFETALSKVGALTGATGEQFEELSAAAREFGATTVFSATEAAEGMAFLAQAGFDTNEILQSSKDFLDLAAAAGSELAQTMDIASNAMQGFGLAASESGRIVDTLTKIFSSSNTNLEQLGEALTSVAPVAASLGVTIEETAAAIGVLGNAGIQGEAAGTALRNILLRLINPTSEVTQGIESLGLSLEQLNPTTTPLLQIFQRLQDAQKATGDATLNAAANVKIFGLRAAAAATVITSATSELNSLTQAAQSAAGAAGDVAAKKIDNLGGSLKLLKSQVQEATLSFAEGGFGSSVEDAVNQATAALAGLVDDGTVEAIGKEIGDAVKTAVTFLESLGDDFESLKSIIAENADTIRNWATVVGAAITTIAGFKLGVFIASIAKLGATFATTAAGSIGVATRALGLFQGQASRTTAVLGQTAAATAAAGKAMSGYGVATQRTTAQLATTAAAQKANIASMSTLGQVAGVAGTALQAAFLIPAAIQFGVQLGKIIDNMFKLSDLGADTISTLRGFDDILSGSVVDSANLAANLRAQVIDANNIADQERARKAILEANVQLQKQIADAQPLQQGKSLSEAEQARLSVLENQLQINKQTLEIFDQLTSRAQTRLANEQAIAQAQADQQSAAAQAALEDQKREKIATSTNEIINSTVDAILSASKTGLIDQADQARAEAIRKLILLARDAAKDLSFEEAEAQMNRILDLALRVARTGQDAPATGQDNLQKQAELAEEIRRAGVELANAGLVNIEQVAKLTEDIVRASSGEDLREDFEKARDAAQELADEFKADAGLSDSTGEQFDTFKKIRDLVIEIITKENRGALEAIKLAKERLELEEAAKDARLAQAKATKGDSALDLADIIDAEIVTPLAEATDKAAANLRTTTTQTGALGNDFDSLGTDADDLGGSLGTLEDSAAAAAAELDKIKAGFGPNAVGAAGGPRARNLRSRDGGQRATDIARDFNRALRQNLGIRSGGTLAKEQEAARKAQQDAARRQAANDDKAAQRRLKNQATQINKDQSEPDADSPTNTLAKLVTLATKRNQHLQDILGKICEIVAI